MKWTRVNSNLSDLTWVNSLLRIDLNRLHLNRAHFNSLHLNRLEFEFTWIDWSHFTPFFDWARWKIVCKGKFFFGWKIILLLHSDKVVNDITANEDMNEPVWWDWQCLWLTFCYFLELSPYRFLNTVWWLVASSMQHWYTAWTKLIKN